MANQSFTMKLPIGFRFHPTDEELVVHYLKRKCLSLPLPANIIPEFDVFQTNPWSFPGDLKEKMYFFGKRNGNKMVKVFSTGFSGYWKATGKKKEIIYSPSNQTVGMKRTLFFYSSNLSKTNLIMHEYSLFCFQNQKIMRELEDWVVYKVFEKKRKFKRNRVVSEQSNSNNRIVKNSNQVIRECCIDLMMEEKSDLGSPLFSPSSSSTEITEIFNNEKTEQEEESSDFKFSLSSSYFSK